MNNARDQLIAWFESGAIPADRMEAALRLAGVRPGRVRWRRFIELLLLWGGVLGVTVGVIFFFAYNWHALGLLGRFGLAELLLAGALAAWWWTGGEGAAGRAALFGAALLTGALLALFGQTYQTGADTWQLFATWALAILPWTLAGRLPLLWLLLVGLLNLSVALYFRTWPGQLLWLGGDSARFWIQFALNLAALAGWETALQKGVRWTQVHWLPRLLALACGVCITWLTIVEIFDRPGAGLAAALPVFIAWTVLLVGYYRRRRCDLFVLSGAALGVIAVVTAGLARMLLGNGLEAAALLLITLAVLGMTGLAGLWLKTVALRVSS